MNIGDTTPVDRYPKGASPYGALDMAGNVWEWTLSLWGKDVSKPQFGYPYKPTDGREDLQAADDVWRVVRGGSYIDDGGFVRCASRSRTTPTTVTATSVFGLCVFSAIMTLDSGHSTLRSALDSGTLNPAWDLSTWRTSDEVGRVCSLRQAPCRPCPLRGASQGRSPQIFRRYSSRYRTKKPATAHPALILVGLAPPRRPGIRLLRCKGASCLDSGLARRPVYVVQSPPCQSRV